MFPKFRKEISVLSSSLFLKVQVVKALCQSSAESTLVSRQAFRLPNSLSLARTHCFCQRNRGGVSQRVSYVRSKVFSSAVYNDAFLLPSRLISFGEAFVGSTERDKRTQRKFVERSVKRFLEDCKFISPRGTNIYPCLCWL